MDFGSLKEGVLTKSDPSFKSWKKRWFILQDNLLYYFESKKKARPLGTVMFSNIRDVKMSDDKIGKANCFLVITDERTYPFSADTENEMLDWMNPVRVLTKLHNSRNEHKDRSGFADQYKHFLITAAKKSVQETIKLTGITKALIGKRANKSRAEQISDDVFNQNNTLGKAAIQGCSMILATMEDVFSIDRLNQMCDALNHWKQTIPAVTKFAEGTPNQAATESTYKTISDCLDEVINHDRPSPVIEVSQSLDLLFLRYVKYLFVEGQEEKTERAKELRTAANEFINSANYVASALPLDKRSEALKLAEKIPDDVQKLTEAVKQASSFTDNEGIQKAEQAKENFKINIIQLCLIYETEWGKSVRKPSVVKEIGSSNAPDKLIENIQTS
jgi:hypothetical protein